MPTLDKLGAEGHRYNGFTHRSNDYEQGDNKFTGRIVKVTIDTKPSGLSAADKKALEDAEDETATIAD